MRKIFISYRREDSSGHAGRLHDRLAAAFGPDSVFMDIEGIEPGVDFVSAIESAMRSCQAVIVLIGPDWMAARVEGGGRRLDDPDDFPRVEVASALARGVTVIPVLVRQARMPSPSELPPDLRGLARVNALELSDQRWDYDTGRLIERLRQVLARAGEAGLTCPSCGRTNPAGTRHCVACGASLEVPRVPAQEVLRGPRRGRGVAISRWVMLAAGLTAAALLLVTIAGAAVALRPHEQTGQISQAPVGAAVPAALALRCVNTLCASVPSADWHVYSLNNFEICFSPVDRSHSRYIECAGSYPINQPTTASSELQSFLQRNVETGTNLHGFAVCQPVTSDVLLARSGLETGLCYSLTEDQETFPARYELFMTINQAGTTVYYLTWFARSSKFADLMRDPANGRIVNSVEWTQT